MYTFTRRGVFGNTVIMFWDEHERWEIEFRLKVKMPIFFIVVF